MITTFFTLKLATEIDGNNIKKTDEKTFSILAKRLKKELNPLTK